MIKTEQLDELVVRYLKKKLLCRKYNTRPLELSYIQIKKAVNGYVRREYKGLRKLYGYDQIRDSIGRLEKYGIIETWLAWTPDYEKRKFYRIKAGFSSR